jgi:Na+/H+-dicarboxylate symporter
VPASIFEAMSTNEILPIVIFSIFFGVALTAVGERASRSSAASNRSSR